MGVIGEAEEALEGVEEALEDSDGDDISGLGMAGPGTMSKFFTIPGKSNDDVVGVAKDLPSVLEAFIEDTNNWFEIIDARIYRPGNVDVKGMVGIPARWRWTIKRWVVNDMDEWLIDRGWENVPHRSADSREHDDSEMEARYMKNIQGYRVKANFYVEFTDDVFEALQNGEPVEAANDMRERNEKLEKARGERRRNRP